MFKKKAFADSIAVTTGLFYIVFYLLSVIIPTVFEIIFNAQFLGADVASLVPAVSFGSFIVTLIIVVLTAWVLGYVWASFYNRFSK